MPNTVDEYVKMRSFCYLYTNRPVYVHNIYDAEFYSRSRKNFVQFNIIFVRDVDELIAKSARTSRIARGLRFIKFVCVVAIQPEIKKTIKFCFLYPTHADENHKYSNLNETYVFLG